MRVPKYYYVNYKVLFKTWKQGERKKVLSSVEYPCRESKHGIKESEGNMFSPKFKGNVQGRKHSGSCAFAEPELVTFRKPKCVIQNKNNVHKNLNNSHNYYDEIELFEGVSNRNT